MIQSQEQPALKQPSLSKEECQAFSRELRELAGGTIFSICFVKRTDGTIRTMHCRFGVKSHLSVKEGNQGAAYDPAEHGLVTVFDIGKRGYRTVPIESILWFRVRGRVYKSRKA